MAGSTLLENSVKSFLIPGTAVEVDAVAYWMALGLTNTAILQIYPQLKIAHLTWCKIFWAVNPDLVNLII